MDEVKSTTPNPQTSPTVIHPETATSVPASAPIIEAAPPPPQPPKEEEKTHSFPTMSFNSSRGKVDDSYLDAFRDPPSKLGVVSLLFSLVAIAVFLLPIVSSKMLNSQISYYIWFFSLLTLGIITLVCGLLSEKNKEELNLLGLMGVVVSIFVILVCVVIAAYYIKYKIEVNGLVNSLNSPNF